MNQNQNRNRKLVCTESGRLLRIYFLLRKHKKPTLGSSIHGVKVLGGRWFCDDSTKASVINRVTKFQDFVMSFMDDPFYGYWQTIYSYPLQLSRPLLIIISNGWFHGRLWNIHSWMYFKGHEIRSSNESSIVASLDKML